MGWSYISGQGTSWWEDPAEVSWVFQESKSGQCGGSIASVVKLGWRGELELDHKQFHRP